MLADIQGTGHNLTDPEIVSLTGAYNDEDHLLFCALYLQDLALNHSNRFGMMMGCNHQEHLKPQITLQLLPDLPEIQKIL